MNNEDILFAVLNSFNISITKINNLFKFLGKPSDVLKAIENNDIRLLKILSDMELNTIKSRTDKNYIKKVSDRLKTLNVFVVTRFSDNVPNRFKITFEQCNCYGLFCKGSLDCLNNKTCAIVGSRTPDAYGKRVSTDFAQAIAKAGATIVSGLAYGIDSIGHIAALENNTTTIAVLGGGFNKIYPEQNTNLANRIIENGGLLVSEYAPHVPSNNYQFPARNRIIASLSDAVVITQFKVKSGAMHTKNYAVEYGKDLFIPLADIYSTKSGGNLATIEEFPNTAVVSPAQVLEALKLESKQTKNIYSDLSEEEITIVKLLAEHEVHFDDIVKSSGFPPQKVNVLLTTLKISGIIKELSGNFFSL